MGKRYGPRHERWRHLILARDPFCVLCKQTPPNVSTVADHIVPIAVAPERQFDLDNGQGLCAPCHNRPKQSEERRGYSTEIGSDGWPIDPRHPVNKATAS